MKSNARHFFYTFAAGLSIAGVVSTSFSSNSAVAQSPSPTETPLEVSSTELTTHFPEELGVDPRTRSYYLPAPSITTSSDISVCISSSTMIFNIGSVEQIDTVTTEDLSISGDLSNHLTISGTYVAVTDFLSLENSVLAMSDDLALGGQVFTQKVVPLDPSASATTSCNSPGPSHSTTFRSIELDFSTVKGGSSLD